MMHRNLDRRVEALVRLEDAGQIEQLAATMAMGMSGTYSHFVLGVTGAGHGATSTTRAARCRTCRALSSSSTPSVGARRAVGDRGELMPSAIPAAGTIPWRLRDGRLEVTLVHRPRYGDWSWPKGKVDPGEEWPVAAVRETREETGLTAHLGIPLPDATYTVMSRTGTPDEKRVRYWAATVTGSAARLAHEVDEVAWLGVGEAHHRLDYARDREQLLAVTQSHEHGVLRTWPLIVVRHAKAVARADYEGADDQRRPLDERGRARAGP